MSLLKHLSNLFATLNLLTRVKPCLQPTRVKYCFKLSGIMVSSGLALCKKLMSGDLSPLAPRVLQNMPCLFLIPGSIYRGTWLMIWAIYYCLRMYVA